MNIATRFIFSGAAAALLCGCAATSLQQTWKAPDLRPPVGRIAVLAVEDRGLVRQGLENRFVNQLDRAGAAALVTYDLLSLEEIKRDKPAAGARFRAAGAQAVLIVRLVDQATSYREVRPGNERYAGTLNGFETTGWYNYFDVGLMDLSPTYGSLKQTVYLEASLYELGTQKRLWSGLTQTVVTEDLNRVAEMDRLVGTFVAALRQDRVVP